MKSKIIDPLIPMKTIMLVTVILVWLGCATEVTALTVSALRVDETAHLPGLALLLGWLGLIGLVGWKCAHNPCAVSTEVKKAPFSK
jgi:hypothetical protein